MSVSRVFNGTIQPNLYSLSDLIGDAVGFYIVTPDVAYEVQIDVFLQLEITSTENRQILLYESRTEIDTTLCVSIPIEFAYSQLSKRFAIYSEFTIAIEIWCIYVDYSVDTETIDDILAELETVRNRQLIDLAEDVAVVANQIAQNTAIALLAGALAPITAGTSLLAEAPLLAGTSTLTTLVLTGI